MTKYAVKMKSGWLSLDSDCSWPIKVDSLERAHWFNSYDDAVCYINSTGEYRHLYESIHDVIITTRLRCYMDL